MKMNRARMIGVSALVAGGGVLFCTLGCGSETKPAAESDIQAQAAPAPVQTSSATEDAQMRALIERAAPAPLPEAQPKETAKTAAVAPPVAAPAPAATTIHVVRKGETLSGISQKYDGTKANWNLILDANHNVVKSPKTCGRT